LLREITHFPYGARASARVAGLAGLPLAGPPFTRAELAGPVLTRLYTQVPDLSVLDHGEVSLRGEPLRKADSNFQQARTPEKGSAVPRLTSPYLFGAEPNMCSRGPLGLVWRRTRNAACSAAMTFRPIRPNLAVLPSDLRRTLKMVPEQGFPALDQPRLTFKGESRGISRSAPEFQGQPPPILRIHPERVVEYGEVRQTQEFTVRGVRPGRDKG
jgi:hypothetical protein